MRLTALLVSLFVTFSQSVAACDGRVISDGVYDAPLCTPADPARIVVLDPQMALGMLWELDVPVLGAPLVSLPDAGAGTRARKAGIADIGHAQQPSLERIVALRPDLIIGDSYTHESLYPSLTRIAPTVLSTHQNWKAHFLLLAEVTGRREPAAAMLKAYETRVADIREHVPEDLTVSVLRVSPNGFQVYLDGPRAYAPYAVLAEAGIRRPAYETTQGLDFRKRPGWEELTALDGDILLYVVANGYDPQGDDALAAKVAANPLWQMLPAVAAGRAWRVQRSQWMGFRGVASAHAVLDDIERFILP